MKAFIDQETCIGCGLCPDICPEVFRMQGDKAQVYVETVPADAEAGCRDAASQCPVEAISVE